MVLNFICLKNIFLFVKVIYYIYLFIYVSWYKKYVFWLNFKILYKFCFNFIIGNYNLIGSMCSFNLVGICLLYMKIDGISCGGGGRFFFF